MFIRTGVRPLMRFASDLFLPQQAWRLERFRSPTTAPRSLGPGALSTGGVPELQHALTRRCACCALTCDATRVCGACGPYGQAVCMSYASCGLWAVLER